jgi:hypothetical protein
MSENEKVLLFGPQFLPASERGTDKRVCRLATPTSNGNWDG